MILTSYSALRHHFAEVARTTAVSLTYDHTATPNTITRASGSFVTDGYEIGQSLDVFGTTANDARYTITSVAALVLEVSEQMNSSETIVSSLTGATYENDGYETWPRALVRAGGFSDTWSLNLRPMTRFTVLLPVTLTVNAGVTDATAGTSYRWYLRQRTDDSALQWFDMAHQDSGTTGTVRFLLTSKCATDLGLATTETKLTAEQQVRLLRNVWVFCRRDSDGAIQQADLLQLSHGTVL